MSEQTEKQENGMYKFDPKLFAPLAPIDSVELGPYKESLDYALNSPSIRNIALSGSYGAGKSSIIQTYERENAYKHFIHISLGRYKENNMVEKNPTCTTEHSLEQTVNYLEGKILNQLLHQINANNISQSAFRIKRKITSQEQQRNVFGFMALVASFLYFLYFPAWCALIETQPDLIKNIILRITTMPLARLLALPLLAFLIYKVLTEILAKHNFQRILKKVDVKGVVGIEIFENSNDLFFNRYLNEVLYLFEQSGADAIVFEDLDRYNVTKIFGELREISDLLAGRQKNSTSASSRSPKFIYLLRDDIFSSSDRSKFFDLIIPVVPVISTKNAYDLMYKRFSSLGILNQFDQRFLRAISLYLSDMRLLNNTINEYMIYHSSLEKGVTIYHSKLLAMILYKNLFPEDFANLQHGKGYVYSRLQKKADLIRQREDVIEQKISELEKRMTVAESDPLKNLEELQALFFPLSVEISSIDKVTPSPKWSRRELVKALLQAKAANHFQKSYNGYREVPFDIPTATKEMESNAEYQVRYKVLIDKTAATKEKIERQIKELEDKRQALETQTLKQLLQDADETFWFCQEEDDFKLVLKSPDFEALQYLMKNGYIDETYDIYISYFYSGSLSTNDKNFLLALAGHRGADKYELDDPKEVLEWAEPTSFYYAGAENLSLFLYIFDRSTVAAKYKEYINFWLDGIEARDRDGEDAFKFLEKLWENLKNKRALIKVISENKPLWFTAWAYSDTFPKPLWRAITTHALLFIPAQQHAILNKDDRLREAISQDPEFFQYERPAEMQERVYTNVIKAMAGLGVRFLKFNYRKEEAEIIRKAYEQNIYELNDATLTLYLIQYCGATRAQAARRSYTCLYKKPNSPMTKRVKQEPEVYVDLLYSKDVRVNDSQEAVLDLLSLDNLSREKKKMYIALLDTKIENITHIKDYSLWSTLFVNTCVRPKWQNVLAYYNQFPGEKTLLDPTLITYLGKEGKSLPLYRASDINESIQLLFNKIVTCIDLPLDAYAGLLQKIPLDIVSFTNKNLPEERVKILAQHGKIKMNTDNLTFMRNNFSQAVCDFILQDKDKTYIKLAEKNLITIRLEEITDLLKSGNLPESDMLRLTKRFRMPISIAEINCSDSIKQHILSTNFSPTDLGWFLTNFSNQSETIQEIVEKRCMEDIPRLEKILANGIKLPLAVYAGGLEEMTKNEARRLYQYLPNQGFADVCEKRAHPTFTNTPDTLHVLKYFQQQNWISSYKILSGGEKVRAYAKHKKPVTIA